MPNKQWAQLGQMDQLFFIKERLNVFISLSKVFDLIHHYNSNKILPEFFESYDDLFYAQSNLHIMILSYAYSLFDKNGIDIRELQENDQVSNDTKLILGNIKESWGILEKPVTKIRHNYGFHGGTQKQLNCLTNVVNEIDEKELLPKIVHLYAQLHSLYHQLEKDLDMQKQK